MVGTPNGISFYIFIFQKNTITKSKFMIAIMISRFKKQQANNLHAFIIRKTQTMLLSTLRRYVYGDFHRVTHDETSGAEEIKA